MDKFYLIQRGDFRETGDTLTGKTGVVDLDYMGSAEFEWGAIPKAYRRLMYHFSEYKVFHTEVYTPEKEELLVFCKKSVSAEIIREIQEFIKSPYHLKEYSELEMVPTTKKNCKWYEERHTNFWWCIDRNPYGDWMAFLEPHALLLEQALSNDNQNWWQTKSPEEQKEEYKNSLH